MPSGKDWLWWARDSGRFHQMLESFSPSPEEAERVAGVLAREMEHEEEDREGVKNRAEVIGLLLERGLLCARGGTARTLLRILDLSPRDMPGTVDLAQGLLVRFPDLSSECLLRLAREASRRFDGWSCILRHPAAGPAIWEAAVERVSPLGSLTPLLAQMPEARRLPVVEGYLRRSTEHSPRYLRYTAELFQGEEFVRLLDQLIGISPYLAGEMLAHLPPSPLRPVRPDQLVPLLGDSRQQTRELALRTVGHLGSGPAPVSRFARRVAGRR